MLCAAAPLRASASTHAPRLLSPRAPPRLPGAARRVVAARASPSDAAPPPFPQGPATGPPREGWRRGLGGVVRVPRVVERRGGAGGEGGKEEGALDGIRSALFANEKTLTRPLFPPPPPLPCAPALFPLPVLDTLQELATETDAVAAAPSIARTTAPSSTTAHNPPTTY